MDRGGWCEHSISLVKQINLYLQAGLDGGGGALGYSAGCPSLGGTGWPPGWSRGHSSCSPALAASSRGIRAISSAPCRGPAPLPPLPPLFENLSLRELALERAPSVVLRNVFRSQHVVALRLARVWAAFHQLCRVVKGARQGEKWCS